MQVNIKGKQFDVSERLRTHIESKTSKFEKFYNPIIDCQVSVSEEGLARKADVVVHIHGQTLKSAHVAETVYAAVDGASDKMERQLKKLHDKRRKPRMPEPALEVET